MEQDDVIVRLTGVNPAQDKSIGSRFTMEFWFSDGTAKTGPYMDFLSGTWGGSIEIQGDKPIISKRK